MSLRRGRAGQAVEAVIHRRLRLLRRSHGQRSTCRSISPTAGLNKAEFVMQIRYANLLLVLDKCFQTLDSIEDY